MSMTTDEAKALLKERGLRVTAPRVAVLRVLAAADAPLSHSEAVELLGDADWDPATIYRNLVKLRDAGLAPVVSRAGGIDRYALASSQHAGPHQHPHFVCDDCGKVEPFEDEALEEAIHHIRRKGFSLESHEVTLHGHCAECR